MERHRSLLLLSILITCLFCQSDSSAGDRDATFTTCMDSCLQTKCDQTSSVYRNQPIYLQLMGWDCKGECGYGCMWKTVDVYVKLGMDVPQFYGKWPFLRIAGFQEPLSVFASIANLLAHLFGILQFRKRVPPSSPLYFFWHLFAIACINGWVWSTVFHTRDTMFTEHMDYFSAFSMVVFSLFSVCVRIFERVLCAQVIATAVAMTALFTHHIYNLAYVKFDYGYNMKANVVIGISNAVIWLVWCYRNRKTHKHVWKCSVFIVLAIASVALEVFDFHPFYWTIDSHSLWHLTTALISPLWYSFLIDDCNYLRKSKLKLQ